MADAENAPAAGLLPEEPPTRPAPTAAREGRQRPFLTVLAGKEVGASHWLLPEGAVIGRSRQASIMFSDDTVSRKHAQISFDGSRYHVKDLGSANGTFVNGKRVEEHVLKDGDRITLGNHAVFRFNLSVAEDPVLERDVEEDVGKDPVTGAFSARHLEAHLTTARAETERSGRPLTALFIRMDALSPFEGRQGGPAGEQALKQVSNLISTTIRRGEDILARLSSDTFCVALHDATVVQSRVLAERILYRLDQLRPFTGAHGTIATLAPVDASLRAWPRLEDALKEGQRALGEGSARPENCVLKALDLG